MGKFIFKRFCIFLCACIVCDARCECGARVNDLGGYRSSGSFNQKNVRECFESENFENSLKEIKSQTTLQIELSSLQAEIQKINARFDEESHVFLQTNSCLLRQKSSVDDASQQIDSPTGSAVSSVDLSQYALKGDVESISEKVVFLEQKLVGAREIIKKLCADSLLFKRLIVKFIFELYSFSASKKV